MIEATEKNLLDKNSIPSSARSAKTISGFKGISLKPTPRKKPSEKIRFVENVDVSPFKRRSLAISVEQNNECIIE